MAQDGVEKGYGIAIVHETRVQADTPKWSGADFVCGVVVIGDGEVFPVGLVHFLAVVLQHGHDEAVAGADIVKQEVSIRMKLLIPERRWDGEGAAVDCCAGGSGGERLGESLEDGNVEHVAANLVVVFPALVLGEVNKSLIGDGLHESITENIKRNSEGTNVLRIWNALLNFRAGEGSVRANGAVVHQGAALNDLGTAGDGNLGILELAAGTAVTDTQFRDLAGATGSGILMALAAGLRVVERPQPVGYLLDFVELDLIRRVRGVVHQPVALVVEARRRLGKRRSEEEKR